MQFPTSTTRREMWLLGSQKDLAAQTQEFVVSAAFDAQRSARAPDRNQSDLAVSPTGFEPVLPP